MPKAWFWLERNGRQYHRHPHSHPRLYSRSLSQRLNNNNRERVWVWVCGPIKTAIDGRVGGRRNECGCRCCDKEDEADVTDEFIKPVIVNGDEGRIKDDDTIFCFNYRSDRMREIVSVLGLPDKPMVTVL
ncbi:hypothetical protein C8F01DRAFT_1246336 [Mycena amicta]|nr:hypothetical protein C8F01DRAFT_1246336 [Mycena amicta]